MLASSRPENRSTCTRAPARLGPRDHDRRWPLFLRPNGAAGWFTVMLQPARGHSAPHSQALLQPGGDRVTMWPMKGDGTLLSAVAGEAVSLWLRHRLGGQTPRPRPCPHPGPGPHPCLRPGPRPSLLAAWMTGPVPGDVCGSHPDCGRSHALRMAVPETKEAGALSECVTSRPSPAWTPRRERTNLLLEQRLSAASSPVLSWRMSRRA